MAIYTQQMKQKILSSHHKPEEDRVDEIREDPLESGTDDNAPSDRRALARQHTTKMLKMLRGYGPREPSPVAEPQMAVVTELASVRPSSIMRGNAESAATAESPPRIVADARASYIRRVEAPPEPPLLSPVAPAVSLLRSAERSAAPVSVYSSRLQIEEELSDSKRALREKTKIPSLGEGLSQQPGVLGQIIARGKELAQLSRIFQAYLPPHLRNHAVLIRIDEEAWTVQTDSAGWATRLRYKLYDIRQALGQQLGIALPKPHIRVEPLATAPQSRCPLLTLTQENAQMIEQTARNEPDPRLSAALRRLAQHAASDDP
ncbi:MAG: DUF721 domain-containing protein [Candidatus Competibacteraceae bacterium]|nr:DUF721 domain-containing protein [Candidatus Competibacteraceae bacterium]